MSNDAYSYQVELIQHTPMIHFQGNQNGATLRATELKPKLDRFIIAHLKGWENIPDRWKVGRGKDNKHQALDYKVRIAVRDDNKTLKNDIPEGRRFGIPCFFANMGGDYRSLQLTLADEIQLTIFCGIPDLMDTIKNRLGEFFLLHNFGMRQSKGFGSFALAGQSFDTNLFDAWFKVDPNDGYLPFNYKKYDLDFEPYFQLFDHIDIFYRNVRSGINRVKGDYSTAFYIKPISFYYCKDVLKKQWDKKSIKEHYLRDELNRQKRRHNNPDVLDFSDNDPVHIDIRDIFGLSSNENWHARYNASVEKEIEDIDRFPSPLLFKPIKQGDTFMVGIKAFDIHPGYLGKKVNVIFKSKKKVNEIFNGRKNLHLKLPGQFDWNKFWAYVANRLPSVDDRSNSDMNLQEQKEYRILKKIFSNIHFKQKQ